MTIQIEIENTVSSLSNFSSNGSVNFFKRLLSAIIIVPLIILPVILEGYFLIIIYLLLLTFIVDELFNIIRNSRNKIFPYIYLIITFFTFINFIILLMTHNIKELFIIIILIIWIFDTFSYLGGSIIKGKKIFPKISKGKTYSGLFSGIIAVTIIYFLVFNFLNLDYQTPYYFVITIAALSFIGDALVSLLKRSASLKDSGNAIPGHGGFLDRMDSFIFVFFLIGVFHQLVE